MSKLKRIFHFSLAEVLAMIIEVLIIGLSQLIFGYGEIKFLVLIYVLARLHTPTRKLMEKLLTRI